jgi:hypothetical protein
MSTNNKFISEILKFQPLSMPSGLLEFLDYSYGVKTFKQTVYNSYRCSSTIYGYAHRSPNKTTSFTNNGFTAYGKKDKYVSICSSKYGTHRVLDIKLQELFLFIQPQTNSIM